jgi:hypothetical protein
MAVQPLLAEMSRINNNGRSKAVEQKNKAQKALGEQIIALTHRERPYMAEFFSEPSLTYNHWVTPAGMGFILKYSVFCPSIVVRSTVTVPELTSALTAKLTANSTIAVSIILIKFIYIVTF